jgi:hypothetical protein
MVLHYRENALTCEERKIYLLEDTCLPCRTVALGFCVPRISVSLILCMFLLVPPKVSLEKYVFLEYAFVLCICFFAFVPQRSINWSLSCHVKYLQLVSRVKDVATVLYLCFLYTHTCFINLWPQSHASRVESHFVPMPML